MSQNPGQFVDALYRPQNSIAKRGLSLAIALLATLLMWASGQAAEKESVATSVPTPDIITSGTQADDLDLADRLDLADSSQAAYCGSDSFYVSTEYLFWWTKASHLPALVTTSQPNTPLDVAGFLGESGTSVLIGDENTSSGPRSGLRIRAGWRLFDNYPFWIDGDLFVLEDDPSDFRAASSDNPILARPFHDLNIPGANSELIGFPGFARGNISVDVTNRFWGAGIALRTNLRCCQWADGGAGGNRIDFIIGYRFFELADRIVIEEEVTSLPLAAPLVVGTRFDVRDSYTSHSFFHGLELGLRGELTRERNFLATQMRVAFGRSYHRLSIDGGTTVTVPGQSPVSFPGGLLATTGRIGDDTDAEFGIAPQFDLEVGRYLTDSIRCSIGYSFIYWSQVVRAANHIRTTLDSTQIPSASSGRNARQPMELGSSSFWAQGLTARLQWRY